MVLLLTMLQEDDRSGKAINDAAAVGHTTISQTDTS